MCTANEIWYKIKERIMVVKKVIFFFFKNLSSNYLVVLISFSFPPFLNGAKYGASEDSAIKLLSFTL